jgi:hypothetical protein
VVEVVAIGATSGVVERAVTKGVKGGRGSSSLVMEMAMNEKTRFFLIELVDLVTMGWDVGCGMWDDW